MTGDGTFRPSGELRVRGIRSSVEVLLDEWGVPHIFADCAGDLFFAQGFVAARDRLYQMEMWRRTRTGELAEVLGSAYVETDRLARLMQIRGELDQEWASYHPELQLIATAFAAGVNAYIASCGEGLPRQFQVLNFRPAPWRPEDCLLRHFSPRISFNATEEVVRAGLIASLGLESALRYLPVDPPTIPFIPPDVDLSQIPGDLLSRFDDAAPTPESGPDGSNCWAIGGARSATGKPLFASDPHRPLTSPALRYVCHLVAPGWNVIGSGEPAIPGVALGHNERIAFGFTVAQFDQADLYVETTVADRPDFYVAGDEVLPMTVLREEIRVKGQTNPVTATLKFTRHGPVIWEDPGSRLAIALKCAGAEPGCAPYLGCLEIGQASDWESFRAAARHWRMPSENLLYADVDNNIAWIAVGLLPVRHGWDGLLPVPGRRGQFEWSGFHPLEDMPQELNPECGFVASANHNIVPPGCRFPIGFDWKAPYRIERIRRFLQTGGHVTAEDFKRLQTDEYSIQAQELVDRLKGMMAAEVPPADPALLLLATWDCQLSKDSAAAALFELWLSSLRSLYVQDHVPAAHRELVDKCLRVDRVIRLLDAMPADVARALLSTSLCAAVLEGQRRLGPRINLWRWGSLHKMRFAPPVRLPAELAVAFETGEFECGGDVETLNSTRGPDYGCNYGPAYRQILDLADWDRSVFVNAPGQSGDPENRHFNDQTVLLLEKDYAPLLYSRAAIERHTAERLILLPA